MNILLKIKSTILSRFFFILGSNQLHQISKFNQIYNIWSNIYMDQVEGDYIEFGMFKGKSLMHSYKCYKNIFKNNKVLFFGLDSFNGFPVENHNFYTRDNFKNNYQKVRNTFKKFDQVKIFKGFFNDSLKTSELLSRKFSFAFIDCDIYESANDAFKYLQTRLSRGAFIMIDDFSSIDKNGNSIYKSFIEHFEIGNEVILYSTYSNGKVYRYMKET